MRRYLYLLTILSALISMAPALAIPVLSLDRIGTGRIAPGGSTFYQLILTAPSDLIGAFSVDIAFNPDVLNFHAAASATGQFGTMLGDPLVDALGLADASIPGMLHLDEVSLLDAGTLGTLQHDGSGNLLFELVLAQITFDGIGTGPGELRFAPGSIAFGNADGLGLLMPFATTPDAIFVVPAPPTLTLMLAGLLALRACRRRVSADPYGA